MESLTPLAPDVWVCAVPLSFAGLRLGTRMTVIRQKDGGLFVHSPISLSSALRAEVDALGPVEKIVAPNTYHHLYAMEWKTAYPDATLFGPAGLPKRQPSVKLDQELAATDPVWRDDLHAVDIHGTMLDETAFFHEPSRTLITADLVENFVEPAGHLLTDLYFKLGGIYKKPGVSRLLRLMYRDKKAARRSLDQVLEWDFDRIALAHGAVVDRGGKQLLRAAYESWLPA